MSDVTKTIELEKLYDSDTDADVEARQFATYDNMLERMTPDPRTWKLKTRVLRTKVFKSDTPRDKARVQITVEATGSEDQIEAWRREYNRLHGLLADNPAEQLRKLQEESDKLKSEEGSSE